MSGAPTRYEVEARIVGPGVSEAACRASRIAFDSSAGQSPDLPGPAEPGARATPRALRACGVSGELTALPTPAGSVPAAATR